MNSIEMLQVCKHFKANGSGAEIRALENLSFSCRPGLVYGLIGPNGSGKTTCLRILSGILRPSSGKVQIAGLDLAGDFEMVRRKVGLVSAASQPYTRLSAKEYLTYCGRLAQITDLSTKVQAIIDELGISEFQNRYCGELSTGMKQRVAIARGVLHEPEVLILDEPTTGLDMAARRSMLELLARLKHPRRTILFSTHIAEEAEKLCDYLLIISHGRLITEGSLQDVVAQAAASDLEQAVTTLF